MISECFKLKRCNTSLTAEEGIRESDILPQGDECPHHHKLFAALPASYRDLPLRLAEYGTDYRVRARAASCSGSSTCVDWQWKVGGEI